MAETLGILGGAAAVLQIADILLTIANRMGDHYKTMRNTPEDIEDIEMHIRIYTANLAQCYDLSTQALERMNTKGRDIHDKITLLENLAKQGSSICSGAQSFLEKVKAAKKGTIQDILARLRWLFRQNDAVHLRMNLMMASSLLGNFIGWLTWEDLSYRLEECKDATMRIRFRRQM
jgi:hypothetical protein